MSAVNIKKEQLQLLRRQLPPFPFELSPERAVPGLQAYLNFYHLDFAARDPALQHVIGKVQSGVFKLSVQFWRKPDARANLLLVHGYTDHTGVFDHLIRWGLDNKFNVLIFDLPGHGLSTGEPAVIDDFGDYSQALVDVLAAVELPALPLYAIGQSTGCAVLMDYVRRIPSVQFQSWPFQAVTFLAPLVRPVGWRWIKIARPLIAPFTADVARKMVRNTSDGAFLEDLKRDPLQPQNTSLRWIAALEKWLSELEEKDLGVGPIHIVQGDEDHTVDWRYNVPVVEKLYPGSRVQYLPGAGHQLANEAQGVREIYLRGIDEWFRSEQQASS